MSNDQQKPWGGRFEEQTNAFVESFTASIDFDSQLGPIDARCSIAHARTLLNANILSQEEFQAIENGLFQIIDEIQHGDFQWHTELEDVHMNVENRLVELIGDPGRKLHTARSRNDQVTATFKVFLREHSKQLSNEIHDLQAVILGRAAEYADTIMPGLTHMQSAQPVTFGHHLMAWFEMLERDWSRLQDWKTRTNSSPMGVAALAGTSFPLDRTIFMKEMGFDSVTRNSLDTVSDRDYAVELTQVLSLIMVHLSRFCEEIVLWNSSAFNLIELPDELCTGSSIMPQKKNPDVAELIRGKSGRVIGSLNALLILLKGQPLAYNRDNQEDKEPLLDSLKTTHACLKGMALLVKGLRANQSNMQLMAARGHPTATDMADWLVRQGVPFRNAHEMCGQAVALAEKEHKELHQLSIQQLKSIGDEFEESVFDSLTLEGSVAARNLPGGTAPETVTSAILAAKHSLQQRDSEFTDLL